LANCGDEPLKLEGRNGVCSLDRSGTQMVFSKTLEKLEWQHSRVVKGNIAEEIATLKQQPGKGLVLFGGVGIAQTFVQRGFIEDYRLVVHPVLLGSGKPLFQDIKNRIPLKLVNTKTFRSGAVLLHYHSDNH